MAPQLVLPLSGGVASARDWNLKNKNQQTWDNPDKALHVLMEELGEVARAHLKHDRAGMVLELSQLGACVLLWLEHLNDSPQSR